jgi:PadR family transcriptional regulator, regulatory protein AphA
MDLARTAFVVLGMLAIGGDRSGYDIRKAIESSVGYFWGESYGQIYPALKQLTALGLIKPGGDPGKQRRQAYRITPAGRAALSDWLAAPFQNDPPRNEFLLKLFFGAEADPSVAIAHIRELERRNRLALGAMEEIEAFAPKVNAAEPGLKYWMLTLRLGMAMTRAALDWGKEALDELEANRPAPTVTARPARTRLPQAHARKGST